MTPDEQTSSERRRQAEQALAALADSSMGQRGECPPVETMAAAVDGSCSGEEMEALLDHIALCSSCYREWLELRSEAVAQGKRSWGRAVFSQLRRSKKLAAIGSALSIAAAVAIFVNIGMEERVMEKTDAETFSRALERRAVPPPPSPAADAMSPQTSDLSLKESGAPSSSNRRAPQQAASEGEAGVQPEKAELQSAIAEDERAPTLQAETQRDGDGSEEEVISQAGSMQAAPLLRSLARGCAEGRTGGEFWRQHHRRLAELAAAGDAAAADELLPLTAMMADGGSLERHCPEIMAILERIGYH